MSQQLINLNDDLRHLRADGYDVAIINGHLAVRGVPYVNSKREIDFGALVVQELRLAGDKTLPPTNHVVAFTGDQPCDKGGHPIEEIRHSEGRAEIAPGLITVRTFSSKPPGGYTDYFHLLATYIDIISNPAKALAGVTAQTYLPYESEVGESVFRYVDTASSRAGLSAINAKLEDERIGIIGVGGAGSYILDLISKTGVKEIHLFDGDHLETHNAYRAPSAISIEELRQMPNKASFWQQRYNPIRREIIAHEVHVTHENVQQLAELTFLFLCLDSGPAKRAIVANLEEMDKPFIDVGVGLEKIDDSFICPGYVLTSRVGSTTATTETTSTVQIYRSVSSTR